MGSLKSVIYYEEIPSHDQNYLSVFSIIPRGINYQHILFVSAHNNIKSTEHSFTKPVTIDADSTGWHRLCEAAVNQKTEYESYMEVKRNGK